MDAAWVDFLNRRYEKIGWIETDLLRHATFNETYDSYMRVYQRVSADATKDKGGPTGPFQNCAVCSQPSGGKNTQGFKTRIYLY